MKIIKLKGGLGNQLFQYAFARRLELEYGAKEVKLDFSYYKSIDGDLIRVPRILQLKLKAQEATEEEIKKVCLFEKAENFQTLPYKLKLIAEGVLNKDYYFEKNRKFRPMEELLKYDYFDGYWQSWRHIKPIWGTLEKELRLKEPESDNFIKSSQLIRMQNSIFVGIRRGDYFADKKSERHFCFTDGSYYINAMNYLIKKIPEPIFYIFSNDLPWIKANLNLPGKIIYRETNDQLSDLEELFLMASCKHAIISNSTYNWWGAWMIQNSDKIVIAPENWFGDGKKIDIVPPEWLKI